MIARPDECDVHRLAKMLQDSLDVDEQLQVTRHLDHCAACQRRLEDLAGERIWWEDTQAVLSELTELDWQPSNDLMSGPATVAVGAQPPMTHDVSPPAPAPDLDRGPARTSPRDSSCEDHWVMGLLTPTEDPQAIGQVDSMPVHSVVGQGGMGVVLKTRDHSLHRFLAIKLLSPMLASSGAARQRFLREAQAAAAVVHPNIVPIYAVSTEGKLPYLVMPFIAGGNLQQHLDQQGPQPVERALSIGLQVAEGLVAAHRQGIVHRDIKPANLMLDEGGFRVMLTDFGLARALDDASLTGSGMVAGTPQFMSPEQALGKAVDHRSDIYSLGAVLYAMATGRPPIRGESTLEMLRRIGEDEPKSILEINERYPRWFQTLVRKLMAKNVADRIQTADEVSHMLRACLAHARSPHQVALPEGLRSGTSWRSRRWGAAVGVVALALALWGGLDWTKRSTSPSSERNRSPANVGEHAAGDLDMGRPQGAAVLSGQSDPLGATPKPAPDAFWSSWDAAGIDQMLLDSEQQLQQLQRELVQMEFVDEPDDSSP